MGYTIGETLEKTWFFEDHSRTGTMRIEAVVLRRGEPREAQRGLVADFLRWLTTRRRLIVPHLGPGRNGWSAGGGSGAVFYSSQPRRLRVAEEVYAVPPGDGTFVLMIDEQPAGGGPHSVVSRVIERVSEQSSEQGVALDRALWADPVIAQFMTGQD
jgi:hypothetical protein